jgi:hypothetical protein
MEGFILLHRKIINNPYYFSETFTRSQAWIDLLLIANYKPGIFYKRGIRVEVKRGQVGYDTGSLAERWRWSIGKVKRFLNELEMDKQIVQQKTNVTTLISINNYNTYQAGGIANKLADGFQTGEQTVSRRTQTKNDNNEDNVKNEKEGGAPPPSFEMVQSFFIENGYSNAQRFYTYYSEKNWTDSHSNQVNDWQKKAIDKWFKPESKIQPIEVFKARRIPKNLNIPKYD